MWREYVGQVGTVVAVANGLLAMIVAMMPVRQSITKRRIGIVALVLAVGAVGATFYAKRLVSADQERQQTERREIRERLDTLILEGRTLLGQIRDEGRDLPNKSADEWAQRAEIYLGDKLSDRYVVWFRRDIGDVYSDAVVPAARVGYWRAVRNRVVNLEMIAAEFPKVPVAAQ
jgi:hypothetical protein